MECDAAAVCFASPVDDATIQTLCGVYKKQGSWNGKSYYEMAEPVWVDEREVQFAMWFTAGPIFQGESELVCSNS